MFPNLSASVGKCGHLSLFALAWSMLATPTHAELSWTQKKVELDANAGTEVVEAHYHFTNSGTSPLDIRQVESSCGCTTAELTQRHYDPGQSGEIVARFTVAGRMGVQNKTLAVWSSDQPIPTTLVLIVRIPEIAHLQPVFVTWAHDEPAKPKVITLEMLQDIPPKDITVQSSNSAISAELQTVLKEHKYQLVVTPTQTSQFASAILTVHCRFGDREQTFRTYATVQPPLSRQ